MADLTMLDSTWSRLGSIAPTDLTDARLQLHHAVQIAVSAAISYIPARSDDSHTALKWIAQNHALVTDPIAAPRPFRIGVSVDDLTLRSFDADDRAVSSFPLHGHTASAGHAWVSEIAAGAGLDGAALTSSKHYTIPEHPVGTGTAFSVAPVGHFAELARYWSNAATLLEDLARTVAGASAVQTWPHHFDIASLITLTAPPLKTIGVGQSPGDDLYAEPYWYVGPRPYPQTRDLPEIAGGGYWHTKGWFGAALRASAIIEHPDQKARVTAFLDSATAACRRLLTS